MFLKSGGTYLPTFATVDVTVNDSKPTTADGDFFTPVNKKEIPCDGCKFEDTCAEKVMECSAFRNWASNGDYVETDVVRFLRAA